jgi:hypothetical protein
MRIEPALLVSQISGLLPVAALSRFGDGRSQYGVTIVLLAFPVVAICTSVIFAVIHRYLVSHQTASPIWYILAGITVGLVVGTSAMIAGGDLSSGVIAMFWFIWCFSLARVLGGIGGRVKPDKS